MVNCARFGFQSFRFERTVAEGIAMKGTRMSKMTRSRWIVFAGLIGLALPVMAEKDEKEQKVEWKSVPEAVRAAIQKRAPGAKVVEVEKETKKGKAVYEATVKSTDGALVEIEVSGDGKVLEFEVKSAGKGAKR